TSKSRTAWRHRTKVKQTKDITPAEKKTLADKRKARNEIVNTKLDNALLKVWNLAETLYEDLHTNSIKYWYERLTQHAGKKKHARQTSRWNAFLAKETKLRNDALPSGVPRPKVHEVASEIRDQWKAMTKDEQAEATEEALVQIADTKEMKKTSTHSVPLNAFHDARATLASVQNQLEPLHHRTGLEMMLVAVRSDGQSVTCPQVWTTGDRVDEFFQLTNRMSLSDFAGKLECFCLSGLQVDIARPDPVGRMFYVDFERHVTERLGIIVVNWPLAQFASPGAIGSRLELQTLYNAWSTGATHFRRLSPAELKTWQDERFKNSMAATTGPGASNDGSFSGTAIESHVHITPPSDEAHPDVTSVPPPPSAVTVASAHSNATSDQHGIAPPQTGVFSVSSATLVAKKPRKPRADKGKKRGPR
ncbi:hypothetical protein BDW22DRAFT_1318831, partial [Trametopsis cervina]